MSSLGQCSICGETATLFGPDAICDPCGMASREPSHAEVTRLQTFIDTANEVRREGMREALKTFRDPKKAGICSSCGEDARSGPVGSDGLPMCPDCAAEGGT